MSYAFWRKAAGLLPRRLVYAAMIRLACQHWKATGDDPTRVTFHDLERWGALWGWPLTDQERERRNGRKGS